MVELADTPDSGSGEGNLLGVQIPSSTIIKINLKINMLYKIIKTIFKYILYFHIILILTVFIFSIFYYFLSPYIYGFNIYRAINSNYKIKLPKYLKKDQIPNYVFKMLIYVEDCNFYNHHGIDFESFFWAVKLYLKYNKPIRGGSTISQQLARILFLTPQRTILRKYLEIIITFEIELIFPKEKILELYINTTEFGKGIFGIEQASRYYFKKSAKYISKEEDAILITLLASPIKYDVNNFLKRRALSERYQLLKNRFLNSN